MKLSTINVAGPDAFEFLQGQLSNDLAKLETDAEILAAWCNPKGRVIWFGTAWKTDSGYGMSALTEMVESIVQKLTVFRFRSKLTLEIVDDGATVDPLELIHAGYPAIGIEQSEQFTPHMLNLDLLDAISFDKGCYTGQEVVARTHYKGATKRRTHRFASEKPVSAGDKVSLDGRDVGTVINTSGTDLLAVVPLSSVDGILSVNDSRLTLQPLPYLSGTAS